MCVLSISFGFIINRVKVMNSRRCIYSNCQNKSYITHNISYFSFPIKNQVRCKEWVVNSGISELFDFHDPSFLSKLKNKFICENHFIPQSFRNGNVPRKTLNRNAVPIKYVTDKKDKEECKEAPGSNRKVPVEKCVEQIRRNYLDILKNLNLTEETRSTDSPKVLHATNLKTYSKKFKKSSTQEMLMTDSSPNDCSSLHHLQYIKQEPALLPIQESPPSLRSIEPSPSMNKTTSEMLISSPEGETDIVNKLQNDIKKLKQLLRNKNSVMAGLRQRMKTFNTCPPLSKWSINKITSGETVIKMRSLDKMKPAWTISEKQLALSLYYKSPGSYRYLIEKLGFNLPGFKQFNNKTREGVNFFGNT